MHHIYLMFAQACKFGLNKTILGCTFVSYDVDMTVHVNIVVKDYISLWCVEICANSVVCTPVFVVICLCTCCRV